MANLKQQIEAFKQGNFVESNGMVNSGCFCFYDWFCKDSSLKAKAEKLFKQVEKFLSVHAEIDQEKTYVFFKNNCPMVGSLYDDFRICDIETGNVIFTVTPKTGHKNQEFPASVWGRENNFKEPLKEGKTFSDLLK